MKHFTILIIFWASTIYAKDFQENFNGSDVLLKIWKSGTFNESQKPEWAIEKVSPTNGVLRKKGYATYTYLVNPEISALNGTLEAKFNIEKGKEDPEAGLVWHFIDSKNYYYIRANSLEKNIVFYRMFEGKKEIVKEIEAKIKPQTWHHLKIVFNNESIQAFLDTKEILSLKDSKILKTGSIGVWSTADTVAAFDDLSFQNRQ
jgi:hypothetical protein